MQVVATSWSTVAARNSTREPPMGTPSNPFTTTTSEKAVAIQTTSAIDQTLVSMISVGVTGMTSRCSIVPCSRSRISAAPVRMIDSIVIELMTLVIAPNQLLSELGLKRARSARSTGRASARRDSGRRIPPTSLVTIELDVAAAGEGLRHARRVDVELDLRDAARQHVALEVRRNDEGEGVGARVHAGVHLCSRDERRAARSRADRRR